jgi:peptide/nickel transport system permease protein
MLRLLARRLLIAIPTLFGITVLSFTFVNFAPGDPLVSVVANLQGGGGTRALTPEVIQALRAKYGLDRPAPVRYVLWLTEISHGNLGRRYSDQRDVAELIFKERLLPTLELMGAALGLAILVGIPLGVICALKQYSRLDYALTVGAFAGVSLPEFFVGILLIYLLAVKLQWFPTSGMLTAGSYLTLGDNVHHLMLPAVVLGLPQLSALMRYARASVLDVVHQDYVRTAWAKGLAGWAVVVVHIFRNALLPLISVVGNLMPKLIGGSAIVESIFQWPGMGLLYLDAVQARDYATIMGLVLITAVMVLLSNLLADIGYSVADPRIRYS